MYVLNISLAIFTTSIIILEAILDASFVKFLIIISGDNDVSLSGGSDLSNTCIIKTLRGGSDLSNTCIIKTLLFTQAMSIQCPLWK